jgi:uncharacterized membrane protein YeaQ/YmgE (transglycosylase-associated protein family)
MHNRWTRALKEGARGATLALIILVLIGTFGGGVVARRLGMSPGLFTLTVFAIALLGAVANGAYSFWRDYHRDPPRA